MTVALSIVVPVFNEEESVVLLHEAVVAALSASGMTFELIFIDDGSRDATFERCVGLVRQDRRVRAVKFRRNYGQTAAMAAGIQASRGEIVVTMDGDLQNDPEDIPRLVAFIEEGNDIVIGWRRNRQDGGGRVLVSQVANRIMARVMGVNVKDSGCSLKAYRSALIRNIPLYGEMHRFIPALSQLAGAKLVQVEVNHRARQFGVSKYGFSRIYKVILDIVSIRALLSYARRPLRWLFWPIAVPFLLALFALADCFVAAGESLVTIASVAVLLCSLSFFLLAWTLIGQLFALFDANVAKFATLAASLSASVPNRAATGFTKGSP